MKRWRRHQISIATLAIMPVSAVSMGALTVNWYTFDSGGGESIGSTLTLRGTFGQWVAGSASGGTLSVCGGFWCAVERPPCIGDANGDRTVNTDDFLLVLNNWGPCPGACPPACLADFDGNCAVDVDDFIAVLAHWNTCTTP